VFYSPRVLWGCQRHEGRRLARIVSAGLTEVSLPTLATEGAWSQPSKSSGC